MPLQRTKDSRRSASGSKYRTPSPKARGRTGYKGGEGGGSHCQGWAGGGMCVSGWLTWNPFFDPGCTYQHLQYCNASPGVHVSEERRRKRGTART